MTPQENEQLYEQCYEALQTALKSVQDLHNVSGDCSPKLFIDIDHAEQRLIDLWIKQITEHGIKK